MGYGGGRALRRRRATWLARRRAPTTLGRRSLVADRHRLGSCRDDRFAGLSTDSGGLRAIVALGVRVARGPSANGLHRRSRAAKGLAARSYRLGAKLSWCDDHAGERRKIGNGIVGDRVLPVILRRFASSG